MEFSPYRPPSDDPLIDQPTFDVPTDVQKAITVGWVTALISASITAVLAFVVNIYLLVDSVLISVLAYFLYRKSRTAGVLLVLFFIAGKIFQYITEGTIRGFLIAAIVFIIYFRATMATFEYHKLKKKAQG